MSDIKKVIQIGKEMQQLSTEYSRLSWVQYTTGYDMGVQAAYKRLIEFFRDKSRYNTILNHLEKDLSYADHRRVSLLEKRFHNYHLSPQLTQLSEQMQEKTNKLSQILNSHRFKLDGKDITSVELSRIQGESDDSQRRKRAFLARTSVNKPLVEGGFVDLIKMRKEYAEIYGASDFVTYSLERSELDPAIFSSWKAELKEQLPQMKKMKKIFANKYLQQDDLQPWDGSYLSGKIAPELNSEINMTGFYEPLRRLFARFGIDISQDNVTYDVFPRKNKSEWGYNFPIHIGVDSRILANVQNRYNEFKVLLHETGHAMHFFRINPEDQLMNLGISGIVSEGIANLFGGFVTEEIFYKDFFADNIEQAKKHFADYNKWQQINSLAAIENIFFDQKLYRQPVESLDDINQLYWNLTKELTGRKPYAAEPVWGYRIHHTTHPIYLHNYFMGDVTCAMLKQVFCAKHNVSSVLKQPEKFGEFVISEVINPSGLYPFAQLFKQISGEDFSLKYLTL